MATVSSNEQKYISTNIYKKTLLNMFLKKVVSISHVGDQNYDILDLGCGEGLFSQQLLNENSSLNITGIDISKQAIKKAKQKNDTKSFFVGDLFKLKSTIKSKQYDKVYLLEVLEHLPNYQQALKIISSLNSHQFIISVPHEPWFSLGNLMMGNNVIRMGTHPEHVNYWNPNTFQHLLDNYFHDVKIYRSFPWIIAVCE